MLFKNMLWLLSVWVTKNSNTVRDEQDDDADINDGKNKCLVLFSFSIEIQNDDEAKNTISVKKHQK